jgi:hypothetical protein
MFVLVLQRWTLGAKFPKKESTTSMRLDKHPVCDAFLPNAVRIHP